MYQENVVKLTKKFSKQIVKMKTVYSSAAEEERLKNIWNQ